MLAGKSVIDRRLGRLQTGGKIEHVCHVVSVPRVCSPVTSLTVLPADRSFMTVYLDLATAHFSSATHRPVSLNATLPRWDDVMGRTFH